MRLRPLSCAPLLVIRAQALLLCVSARAYTSSTTGRSSARCGRWGLICLWKASCAPCSGWRERVELARSLRHAPAPSVLRAALVIRAQALFKGRYSSLFGCLSIAVAGGCARKLAIGVHLLTAASCSCTSIEGGSSTKRCCNESFGNGAGAGELAAYSLDRARSCSLSAAFLASLAASSIVMVVGSAPVALSGGTCGRARLRRPRTVGRLLTGSLTGAPRWPRADRRPSALLRAHWHGVAARRTSCALCWCATRGRAAVRISAPLVLVQVLFYHCRQDAHQRYGSNKQRQV